MPDSSFFVLLFQFGLPVGLIVLGYLAGTATERAHFRRLEIAERELLTIPMTDLRTPPPDLAPSSAFFVTGSVVIGSDYFKTFAAWLRNLVGGEVRSFERLLERARREAICRLLREAHDGGARAVINLRIDTSRIGTSQKKSGMPMVEVIASGTAIL